MEIIIVVNIYSALQTCQAPAIHLHVLFHVNNPIREVILSPHYTEKETEVLRSYIFGKQTHSNDQRQYKIKLLAMLLSWSSFSEPLISFLRCPEHRALTESIDLSLSWTHGFQYNLRFSFCFFLFMPHLLLAFFFSLPIEDFYPERVHLNALSPPYHLL